MQDVKNLEDRGAANVAGEEVPLIARLVKFVPTFHGKIYCILTTDRGKTFTGCGSYDQ